MAYRSLQLLENPLATLTDEAIKYRPIIEPPVSTFDHEWFEKFRFSLYDWDDPDFARTNVGPYAWRPVQLCRCDYFFIVSPHDYSRITAYESGKQKRWYPKINHDDEDNIIGVYARRRGRAADDEMVTIYAHRELVNHFDRAGVVDHKNGYGLDNRRGTSEYPVNLRFAGPLSSRSENAHNAMRKRTVNADLDLPKGVAMRGDKFIGQICKRCRRTQKVRSFRSRPFATAGEAHAWYRAELMRMNKNRDSWAHNPASVNIPNFPCVKRSTRLFMHGLQLPEVRAHDEVPF